MKLRLSLILGMFVLFAGCDPGPTATTGTVPPTQPVQEGEGATADIPREDPVTSGEVKREIKQAFDAAREYSAEKRDELAITLQQKKDVLDRKINELEAKSAAMTEEARADWAREKVVIQQRKAELEAKIEQLKKSAEPAWQDLKEGTSQAWNEFEQAVENAASRFKSDDSVE